MWMHIYIYIYILFAVLLRGNRLSNTTCLMHSGDAGLQLRRSPDSRHDGILCVIGKVCLMSLWGDMLITSPTIISEIKKDKRNRGVEKKHRISVILAFSSDGALGARGKTTYIYIYIYIHTHMHIHNNSSKYDYHNNNDNVE